MLVQFTTGNFLSFKERVTFSTVATSIKEHRDTHIFKVRDLHLLKSSAIYGANASGKSNIFKAMSFMKNFILDSAKDMQIGEKINVEVFKLSTETINEPSFFEIIFVHKDVLYRYGFRANAAAVVDEWLFFTEKSKEKNLFLRNGNQYKVDKRFTEGLGLELKTRENALFLSVVAQFNGSISTQVLGWFNNFNIISGLSDKYLTVTADLLEDPTTTNQIKDIIRLADLGIEDVQVSLNTIADLDSLPQELREHLKELINKNKKSNVELKEARITMAHNVYNQEKKVVSQESFELSESESQGTIKIFALVGPIIDTLNKGKVLVIDEIDSRLHPLLTRFIINMFNCNERNLHNAQLIFNTHDTNLLSRNFLRRDQIWFTEKNKCGESDLYSLIEYNVRNDASYSKDYLNGKYGSIPFIRDFQFHCDSEGDIDGDR